LDQELEALKNAKKMWYTFDLSTPGVIFIKLVDCLREHVDIFKISEAIMAHLGEGEPLTRFTCRLIPVHLL
jgi:hypothetical protein